MDFFFKRGIVFFMGRREYVMVKTPLRPAVFWSARTAGFIRRRGHPRASDLVGPCIVPVHFPNIRIPLSTSSFISSPHPLSLGFLSLLRREHFCSNPAASPCRSGLSRKHLQEGLKCKHTKVGVALFCAPFCCIYTLRVLRF